MNFINCNDAVVVEACSRKEFIKRSQVQISGWTLSFLPADLGGAPRAICRPIKMLVGKERAPVTGKMTSSSRAHSILTIVGLLKMHPP